MRISSKRRRWEKQNKAVGDSTDLHSLNSQLSLTGLLLLVRGEATSVFHCGRQWCLVLSSLTGPPFLVKASVGLGW